MTFKKIEKLFPSPMYSVSTISVDNWVTGFTEPRAVVLIRTGVKDRNIIWEKHAVYNAVGRNKKGELNYKLKK